MTWLWVLLPLLFWGGYALGYAHGKRDGVAGRRFFDGVEPIVAPVPVPEPDHSLLTVAEVARSAGVSNMTIYRLIRSGDLAAMRVGRSYRIRSGDAARLVAPVRSER